MAPATAVADPPPVDADAPPDRPDEEILEEVRERRSDAMRAWQDIRAEGAKDLLCVAGQVWEAIDPVGLEQRKNTGRPAISCDEIGQYLNQVGNDVRQNKRAVKATPIGNGANDKTAEFKQNLIRQIEYESNAQRDVYAPIFEDALQRSYGYGRINAVRVDPLSRNMKLMLEHFPNPEVVTVDPDGAMLAPDCSKIQYAFIAEVYSRKQFKKDFPDAQIVDFTTEHQRIAPDWFKGDGLTVAEYWTVEKVRRRVVFFKAAPDRGFFAHMIPGKVNEALVASEHFVDVPYVCHYLTNGVELLKKPGEQKKQPWPGKSIPIFSCYGKVLYVPTATGTQRRMLSMVRLARDPVMLRAYIESCKAETIGAVPRTTWVGYEGQFREHETEWAKANHEPVPYLQVKPKTAATGDAVLPLPERQSWDPPLQNLELASESARRAIQAAMGTSPLPTDAQRQNQKSGKALDRIDTSAQKGSYHFVDHLDGMITRVGVLSDELIPHYYDTARDVTVRKPDDQSAQVRINDPAAQEPLMLAPEQQHDIVLSVGPAYTDERAAASDFADLIVGNVALMQIAGPEKALKLNAMAIRLKNVGPVGDEMADTLDPKPPEEGEPPTPQQVAELQAQLQQAQQSGQQLQQAVETDRAKHEAQIQVESLKQQGENERAAADADLQITLAQMQHAAQIEVARINAEKPIVAARIKAEEERLATGLNLLAQMESESAARVATATEADAARAHESTEAERARTAAADEAERGRQSAAEQAEAQRVADAAAQGGGE